MAREREEVEVTEAERQKAIEAAEAKPSLARDLAEAARIDPTPDACYCGHAIGFHGGRGASSNWCLACSCHHYRREGSGGGVSLRSEGPEVSAMNCQTWAHAD
jgi:hypothetical protein